NHLRGLAVSVVGLINSAVSFVVQLVFPWELAHFGSALTFAIYGVCALSGWWFVWRVLPETRGRSLEAVAASLMRS
ncbi:MAG: MFS transporter, partial [Pseudomonadota bacterium]